MKKVLILAALVLGMVSCQKDFAVENESHGEVSVQLAVAAPELIGATRTDGDAQNTLNSAYGAIDYLDGNATGDRQNWSKVDLRYSLEVYDETDPTTPVKDRMVIIKDKYEPVTFELRLIPNRDYRFVVFADFVDDGLAGATVNPHADAQKDLGLRHTINGNLTNITIKQNVDDINDELADAYFKAFTYTPTNSSTNKADDVILQRPYAKVRVVATDLADLNLNVEPKYVYVNYGTSFIPTTFNAVTGEIGVDKNSSDKEFDDTYVEKIRTNRVNHVYNADYDAKTVTADNGEVRASHLTLFTDYILATDAQAPISFQMTVCDENNNPIKAVNFNTNIPVQRNYLTTIVGNVLTAATEITVTIDDNFANADKVEERPFYQVAVSTGYEFVQAFYEGREIILQDHITVTEDDVNAYLATRSTTAINPVLNLNGFTITFVNNGDDALLTVADGSSLTIEDNVGTGAVVLEGEGNAIENNGELIINNTTLTSNGEGSVIENNAEVNIEGSTLNEGALENNGEANIADSTLNAGSVENNGTANLNDSDVADDAVENGDDAIVGTYVYTAEQLQTAINAAEVGLNNEVSFGADIVGDVTILQKEGVNLIINGRDFEFDGVITVNGGGRANGNETLTFKAINFATEGSDFTFISAPSKIDGAYNYSHNVTIESCTFNGNQTVGSASFTGTYNFVMKNCKATSMHSILQLQSVDNKALVEKVETVNCKNGLSFGNTAYPTLKNSTIKASEYGVRADGDASRGALLLEDNTIEANVPVIVRKTTTKYDVTLVNNAITKGGVFEVVFTNGKDDEEYVAPTGTYTITGAEDYMVYPRNSVANWDEFVATKASKVVLLNDITYDKSYTITKDITVDLNGKTFAIDNVSAMLNIGDSKNSSKPNVTIKNGNFNTIIYALSGNVTIQDVVFGGTISYVSASQGVVSTKYANLLMERCKMTNVKKSGSTKPRSLCTEGRSSGYLILRDCNFKNSNLDRPYINPLNGTATLELTNCSLYGGATNIDLGASLVWSNTNLNLNGCSGGFTFTISRASTSLTEDELAVYRAIKQNNSGSKRFIFTDGEKNNL